jgi:hypothetical protein
VSTLYPRLAETVVDLLRRYGAAVTLPRTTGGSIDPVTGVVVAGTAANKTSRGVVTVYKIEEIDGSLVQAGDRKLLLDASEKPLMTDKPQMCGESLGEVVSITELNPAGVPVAYIVQVRK